MVREWPDWAKKVIGAFLVGLAATYIDLSLIAAFGAWRNVLTHVMDNAVIAIILGITNLIGLRIRRVLLANLLLAILILIYELYMFFSFFDISTWPLWWPVGVSLIVLPLLNSWLFSIWLSYAYAVAGHESAPN